MADTNVVSITGHASSAAMQPNKPIIETLETLLRDAKAGRIQHLVAIHSDGHSPPVDLYQGTGELWQVLQLIGTMELCKITMLTPRAEEVI